MTHVHELCSRSARSAARIAGIERRKVDITLAIKAGETTKLSEHSPTPHPAPNADLIRAVSQFLHNRYGVAPSGRWYSLKVHRAASIITLTEECAVYVIARHPKQATQYGLGPTASPRAVELAIAKLEPGVQAELRQSHRKLWHRRRAALEQDVGAVLPLLASRPEHRYPHVTRRLTQIEDLIPSEIPSASIEIPASCRLYDPDGNPA